MLQTLLNFYKKSSAKELLQEADTRNSKYKNMRWSVFSSITIGYSLFYVCRLSLSVVKSPIINEGVLSESQLGIIGSALFFAYAFGRFTNGFLADRSNTKRFMSTGLLASSIINLILGFNSLYFVFVVLWGLNGWFQSMGAATSIVGLSRWFGNSERGTYYGIWSTSHSSGNAITYLLTSVIVGLFGWRWGFTGASIVGVIGAIVIIKYLYDSPESEGLPPISQFKNEPEESSSNEKTISSLQVGVLKNPYVWILALSSAFMYVSRYAIESWGIFYLENAKGYTNFQASSILSIYAVMGIVSTVLCGFISDRFFNSNRNKPALFYGIINVIGISILLFYPDSTGMIDTIGVALFGFGTGALITYLGGLMAIDIVSKKASGAAVGVVGIASYIGAGVQDVMSGNLLENSRTVLNGIGSYDFTYVQYFWVGSAVISVILTLFVWNAKPGD
jgi:OPA family sugar phosphate sensor protein UhpC-like MFS transporter